MAYRPSRITCVPYLSATTSKLLTCSAVALGLLVVAAQTGSKAAEMSAFDACVIETKPDNPLDCNKREATTTTEYVEEEVDSTDTTITPTEFRFAGAGLGAELVSGPSFVGNGEYRYENDSKGYPCMRYEKTVAQGEYLREDGVYFQKTERDENGDPTYGSDILRGNACTHNDIRQTSEWRHLGTQVGGSWTIARYRATVVITRDDGEVVGSQTIDRELKNERYTVSPYPEMCKAQYWCSTSSLPSMSSYYSRNFAIDAGY